MAEKLPATPADVAEQLFSAPIQPARRPGVEWVPAADLPAITALPPAAQYAVRRRAF